VSLQREVIVLPAEYLQGICDVHGGQVDISRVSKQVDALKPPVAGPPDPVTKLWPRHISKEVRQRQEGMSTESHKGSDHDSLKKKFPEYFEVYGYE
jgi:hypothetical protein